MSLLYHSEQLLPILCKPDPEPRSNISPEPISTPIPHSLPYPKLILSLPLPNHHQLNPPLSICGPPLRPLIHHIHLILLVLNKYHRVDRIEVRGHYHLGELRVLRVLALLEHLPLDDLVRVCVREEDALVVDVEGAPVNRHVHALGGRDVYDPRQEDIEF